EASRKAERCRSRHPLIPSVTPYGRDTSPWSPRGGRGTAAISYHIKHVHPMEDFMKLLKRTWADVSLDALAHNYRAIRGHIQIGCKFLGVMKADAYGHGAVPMSHALVELGAEYLAVSNLEEAVQIRRGGI